MQDARARATLRELWETPQHFFDGPALLPGPEGSKIFLLARDTQVLSTALRQFEHGFKSSVAPRVETVPANTWKRADVTALLPRWLVEDVRDSYRNSKRALCGDGDHLLDARQHYFCFTLCALFDGHLQHWSEQSTGQNRNASYVSSLAARLRKPETIPGQFGSILLMREPVHFDGPPTTSHFAVSLGPGLFLHKPGSQRIEVVSGNDLYARYGVTKLHRYYDVHDIAHRWASRLGLEYTLATESARASARSQDDFLNRAWTSNRYASLERALAVAAAQKEQFTQTRLLSPAQKASLRVLEKAWPDQRLDNAYAGSYLEWAAPGSSSR